MKKLLCTAAMLTALALPATAATITDFGVDPTSAAGTFQHSLGTSTSAFDDQYTFRLDQTMTLTIASVTNVYSQISDFITNFQGSVVYEGADGAIGGGDDVTVIGPVGATGCPGVPVGCQGFAGSAVLGPGSYFLDISGIAGGSSGYGGNLATFSAAVPGPIAGAGLPGIVAACLAIWGWNKRRRRARVVGGVPA